MYIGARCWSLCNPWGAIPRPWLLVVALTWLDWFGSVLVLGLCLDAFGPQAAEAKLKRMQQKIGELKKFPVETRRQLLHILLSHHGEYDFGSPRRPKTPEALLVHMVDNLDSKMAGMMEAIAAQGSDDEAWTPYSRILERHIYRRRMPSNDEGSE